jgi:hypothetical protein
LCDLDFGAHRTAEALPPCRPSCGQTAREIGVTRGHDPKRGFAGGYHFETIPLGFAVFGAVMMPDAWGEAYARDIEKYTRFAGMWICGKDLPQAGNRITRDSSVNGALLRAGFLAALVLALAFFAGLRTGAFPFFAMAGIKAQ